MLNPARWTAGLWSNTWGEKNALNDNSQRHSLRLAGSAVSPIDVIPPEILVLILCFVCSPPGSATSPAPIRPACMIVSQVSSLWRSLAYALPEIWASNLPQQHPELTKHALKYGYDHPVSFHAFPRYTEAATSPRQSAYLSLAELPRAQHVVVGHPGMSDPSSCAFAIKRFEEKPAPLLRTLTLVYGVLGKKALCGETPALLYQLILYDSWASPFAPIFRTNLTELALVRSNIGLEEPEPELVGIKPPLIALLGLLPSLRRLVLEDGVQGSTRMKPTSSAHEDLLPIALSSNLEYVRMQDGPRQIKAFLSWLSIPLSTVLDIRAIENHGRNLVGQGYTFNPVDALDAISKHHLSGRVGGTTSYTRLRIAPVGGEDAEARSASVALVLSDPVDGAELAQSLAFIAIYAGPDGMSSPITGLGMLLQTLDGIPSSRVRSLELTHPTLEALSIWPSWQAFSTVMPALKRIVIRGSPVYEQVVLEEFLNSVHDFTHLRELGFERLHLVRFSQTVRSALARCPALTRFTVTRCVVEDDWEAKIRQILGDRFECQGLNAGIQNEPEEDYDIFAFPREFGDSLYLPV
ncbi:hypothetical protein PENSPDRAFT_749383 [Peniophora sp. CONT]|nr:hypothetical protein PENSPDRAFT_749383 [Peniophora sp. CONT]